MRTKPNPHTTQGKNRPLGHIPEKGPILPLGLYAPHKFINKLYQQNVSGSCFLGRVRLGSIWNKNNWNNATKRLFGSYSHSGIPGFPSRIFCSQEQNSRNIFRNIFLFRNIPNERALNYIIEQPLDIQTTNNFRDNYELKKFEEGCMYS